jgi:hypothetical protein
MTEGSGRSRETSWNGFPSSAAVRADLYEWLLPGQLFHMHLDSVAIGSAAETAAPRPFTVLPLSRRYAAGKSVDPTDARTRT